eukprot:gnl/TRDRNA2_/TRDRNA2_35821_c1_seq1.p1 gnl/TRDRNA2_/TRDRNA2_35821_c1~~gnl/TRDRNA2_/TRDRNA2_35821_c1_seq1.p1  ORF type:complete len:431 (-),score=68.77 gnl/TRDRNA2_/TRDRNA2_35821_c1_seq1:53-1255(-)
MGLEPWEYPEPQYAKDECVKSVWRLSCYTYFPRASVGCQAGAQTPYIRPCQSSCHNYIRQCGVECCDESVQCVFTHTKNIDMTHSVTTEGYAAHDGPSGLCTGGARRSRMPSGIGWLLLLLQALWMADAMPSAAALQRAAPGRSGAKRLAFFGLLLAVAFSLQGCNGDIASHTVGNWRGEEDYLITFEFVPPGKSFKEAKINSCQDDGSGDSLMCSGRGMCRMWDDLALDNPLAFCECDRDYADPECKTKRKSQATAYFLSLLFGWLGADLFYLGFPLRGLVKLCTLGGAGTWWAWDVVRIGSSPVYADNFKTAADLPHYVFVICTVMSSILAGFTVTYYYLLQFRREKRHEALMLQAEEEARLMEASEAYNRLNQKKYGSAGGAADYGSAMPAKNLGPI